MGIRRGSGNRLNLQIGRFSIIASLTTILNLLLAFPSAAQPKTGQAAGPLAVSESPNYCLAQTPAAGAEYMVYAPSGGLFYLDISAMPDSRRLKLEWFNPATRPFQLSRPGWKHNGHGAQTTELHCRIHPAISACGIRIRRRASFGGAWRPCENLCEKIPLPIFSQSFWP